MFDTDGNGVIDFDEFTGLWQYVCDWQDTFRNFDLDNSGTIDRNELKLGKCGARATYGWQFHDESFYSNCKSKDTLIETTPLSFFSGKRAQGRNV